MGRARLCSELGMSWDDTNRLKLREFSALLGYVDDVHKARDMRQRTASLL